MGPLLPGKKPPPPKGTQKPGGVKTPKAVLKPPEKPVKTLPRPRNSVGPKKNGSGPSWGKKRKKEGPPHRRKESPPGKNLLPGPLGASTPGEDPSLPFFNPVQGIKHQNPRTGV